MVESTGKFSRKITILLTPGMRDAMDLLLKTRDAVGIWRYNKFFFAQGDTGHMDGYTALKKACADAQLEKPEFVTTVKLRKYLATVTQVSHVANKSRGEFCDRDL